MEISSLLKLMAHKGASDLFIIAGKPPCLKVNGTLETLTDQKLTPAMAQELVSSVMSPKQREEFERTKECNFAIHQEGYGRFRVSAYIQRNTPGMVLRRIAYSIPSVEELNLPHVINELAMTKRGLILFVGATGTGKSTSLAAMIKYRNEHSYGHIITIEDPLEYLHPHAGCIVSQRRLLSQSMSPEPSTVHSSTLPRCGAASIALNTHSAFWREPTEVKSWKAYRATYFIIINNINNGDRESNYSFFMH